MNLFLKIYNSQPRWELVVLVFVSLFLHLAGLWFLGQSYRAKSGLGGAYEKSSDRSPSLSVSLLISENPVVEIQPFVNYKDPLKINQKTNTDKEEISKPSLSSKDAESEASYFSAGQLTRLPSPINEIDLNIAEIDEVATAGVIELTVLVKADGTVAHVSISIQDDKVRHFADLISARFLSARFSPGEIEGKAVNSEFKITVVSESIS